MNQRILVVEIRGKGRRAGVQKFKRVDKSSFDMKYEWGGGKGEERISVEWLVRKASRSTLMTFKKKKRIK